MDFTVTAARGTEHIAARELQAFGAGAIQIKTGAVLGEGSLETLYRTCLWCRTGLHVLLPLHHFEINSQEDFFEQLLELPWQDHLRVEQTFMIDFHAIDSAITHNQYGAQRVKDAIVDSFRARTGVRPSVDREAPQVRFSVFVDKNQVTISLDLSGESLHRRGYRVQSGPAPLKETLAAALLLRSNWYEIARRGGGFIDPLCGSGTLLIEAALIAADIAPGLLRPRFGFTGWSAHDATLWQTLVEEARERRRNGLKHLPKLYGFDRDTDSLSLAQRSLQRLGLESVIEVKGQELLRLTWPEAPSTGLVLTNPPYGERLGSEVDSVRVHQEVGRFFLSAPQGWRTALFTHIDRVSPLYGLEMGHQYPFMNGPLPCRLVEYVRDAVGVALTAAGSGAAPARPVATDLINHLRKNAAHLKKWRQKSQIEAYRLYDANLPEFAAAIDAYGDVWHVQEYAPPKEIPAEKAAFRRLQMIDALCEVFATTPAAICYKTRQRQRGNQQYERIENSTPTERVIHENGLKFRVNLTDYLDTGLFLDHRLTRQMVGQWASGKKVLNLFCYTGSFSVYAAAGGAASVDSVDLSNTYLDWCEDNFRLNQLQSPRWRFLQADCLRFIDTTREQSYDLIILDPPTFSNSKRMDATLDIQRDHVTLIQSCLRLLAPGGKLLFSTNRQRFVLDEAALRESCDLTTLTTQTTDRDYQRKPAHQCWLLEISAAT